MPKTYERPAGGAELEVFTIGLAEHVDGFGETRHPYDSPALTVEPEEEDLHSTTVVAIANSREIITLTGKADHDEAGIERELRENSGYLYQDWTGIFDDWKPEFLGGHVFLTLKPAKNQKPQYDTKRRLETERIDILKAYARRIASPNIRPNVLARKIDLTVGFFETELDYEAARSDVERYMGTLASQPLLVDFDPLI